MLNLIDDAWIPVIDRDGIERTIAPWQMAEQDIIRPAWPRMDMNVACYEFLIGCLALAVPPKDDRTWDTYADNPDPLWLKEALAPYAPAFNLLGDGPRFLQDFEPITGNTAPVDMLFIDSAGDQASKHNKDVMVHRHRYDALSLPEAAMALYVLQAWAPSGGSGNRTSMRGGGPLVTLADPGTNLWGLVWCNTPCGEPAPIEALPWMRPTRTSEKNQELFPPEGRTWTVEAFFGMPRRLRLIGDDRQITAVVQKPYGTNYAGWKHPLTPYYRQKPTTEFLPRHPSAGRFSYRQWLGITMHSLQPSDTALRERAQSVYDAYERKRGISVMVAGWAMDNMKPCDFIYARQPLVVFPVKDRQKILAILEVAEAAVKALRRALASCVAEGSTRESECEAFYRNTEAAFMQHVQALLRGENPARSWVSVVREQALAQFNALALPGLSSRRLADSRKIVIARNGLLGALANASKANRSLLELFGEEVPQRQKKETE